MVDPAFFQGESLTFWTLTPQKGPTVDVGPPALEGPRDPELGETTGRPCDLATALQYLAILVAAKHRGGLPRSPSAGRCWPLLGGCIGRN